MTTSAIFKFPSVVRRHHEGPLGIHVDAYEALLREQGYSRGSTYVHLHLVADLSRWLRRRRLDAGDVDECTVERYFSLDSASSIHIAARPSSRTSFSVCCVIGGSSPTRRCRLWLIHARLWSTHSGNICPKSGGCQYRLSAITHVSRISSFGSDSAAVPLSCLRCLPRPGHASHA